VFTSRQSGGTFRGLVLSRTARRPGRFLWAIGVPVVAGCGLFVGWGLFLLIWIVLANANLIHIKGVVRGQEPSFFDNYIEGISLACVVLGVLSSLYVYSRIWRRRRRRAA